MKNLIVAITFAIFSLTLPLTMAQQVVDEDSSLQVETSIKKKEKSLRIDIDLTDAENAEEEIQKVIKTVGGILGEKMGKELASELENLDTKDRSHLNLELRKLFHNNDFRINDDGEDMNGIAILIPILAITFTLGMPVIILLLVLMFGYRKRKQKMELISSYLAADKPVPEYVMAEFGSDSKTNSTFRSGLTFTLVGIAISIFFGTVEGWGAATVGLIPIAIGVARLITWKFDNRPPGDQAIGQ